MSRERSLALGLVGILAALLLWQILVSLGWLNPVVVPSPSTVMSSAIQEIRDGTLGAAFVTTVGQFLLAFAGAALLGTIAGFLVGWFRTVEYVAEPYIWFFYSTPLIAFYPVLVIWFGLGFKTAVVLGFLLAVVPVLINTATGVKSAPAALVRAARSFGATRSQLATKVVLPHAMPLILTGWRIAVERALIGVVVGEMFSANAGLGFQISYYGSQLLTANLFVPILAATMLGLAATQILRAWENWALRRVAPPS
jgi:ABC-type nitrate/sulfonate/bicarbonate transport system permease component